MTDIEDLKLSQTMWVQILTRLILLPPVIYLAISWPAGDWYWVDAWLITIAFTILVFIAVIWLAITQPETIRQRMRGSYVEDQSMKNSIVVFILSAIWLAVFPVAGLDYRFDIMQLGLIWKIIGWMMYIISIYVLKKVFDVNRYLSKSVIVQKEKQEVVTEGMYGLVRHPMYFGMLLMILGSTLILGSLLALLISIISGLLLYIRTIFEEELLEKELDGYKEYKKEVTKRLIPYII